MAHKPWRVEEAESALAGKPADEHAFGAAADILLRGAQGHGQNDFKLTLARNAIEQALTTAARGTKYAKGEQG